MSGRGIPGGGDPIARVEELTKEIEYWKNKYRKQNDQVALMLSAMTEFCMRVDRGEVRSVKTYAQFKSIIKEVTNGE